MGNQQRPPYNDPHSKTYNPGWRNHPNFGWGGNQGQRNNSYNNPPQSQPFPNTYHPPYQPNHTYQPPPPPVQLQNPQKATHSSSIE
ncbi:hypothetical protein PIB30_075292, partial [Stylosanthes scabra]|nr:hypothetical protein [Stylosanthes scabra]